MITIQGAIGIGVQKDTSAIVSLSALDDEIAAGLGKTLRPNPLLSEQSQRFTIASLVQWMPIARRGSHEMIHRAHASKLALLAQTWSELTGRGGRCTRAGGTSSWPGIQANDAHAPEKMAVVMPVDHTDSDACERNRLP
jgi:hypothetical protein